MIARLIDLKTFLDIASDTDDVLLTSLLERAEQYVQTRCNRLFEQELVTDKFVGEGDDYHSLQSPPAEFGSYGTTTWIKINDVIVDEDSFVFDEKTGIVTLKFSRFTVNVNCEIKYTGGYATIPGDMIQAVIEIAAMMFNANKTATSGVKSESMGDISVTYSEGFLKGLVMGSPQTEQVLKMYEVVNL